MTELYCNGRIYEGGGIFAEAFIVEDGRFKFVGSNEEAMKLDCDARHDLGGKFVCPGFNDSHMHLFSYGWGLLRPQLGEHTRSLSDMLECMSQFLRDNPRDENTWLVGRGWNHDLFTDTNRMPNRCDLDRVSDTVPVCAVRACGHCLSVNSRAINMLGIDKSTPDPDGGRIGRDKDGEPDGIFYDNAMNLIYRAIPPEDKDEIKAMIIAAAQKLNSYGVTSCHSDDYSQNRAIPWQTINEAYRELADDGLLTVRVYEQSNFTSCGELADFIEKGNITGAGDDMFKIGPLKMMGDGALGARTAYLSKPYEDDRATCGIPVFPPETFREMISYANAHNMQVAVHCIGDKCLDVVLDAVENALSEHPKSDARHGVVHCQITRREQLERIARLNMHVYYQGIFIDYDSKILKSRVGDKLAETSYFWKTLSDMGVSCSNGTDCPVETPDALKSIQCAITRRSLDGSRELNTGEAFSVGEALDGYTVRSAEGSFEEAYKGRIKAGYLADFVVLGENPFEIESSKIGDIPVIATYLGGKKVK